MRVLVFDVSRLISRARKATPTGIDRVELAYAQHLITATNSVCFVKATRWGRLALLSPTAAASYVEALSALWRDGPSLRRRARVRWAALRLRLTDFGKQQRSLGRQLRAAQKPLYLLVSHHHLEKHRLFARLKRRDGFSVVCLIHDLIPIEFPEYARPGQDKRHRQRIETAAAFADVVIVPSGATGDALRAYIERVNPALRTLVAPFGVEPRPVSSSVSTPLDRPYFVCLGTIEPRKNHLLLLNLWRELAFRCGQRVPGLILIGRRGWEIENPIDMLDRCPALRGIVSERNCLCDREIASLLVKARVLLLPSFAEGFGFPLVEALALGTPVLASDISALREIGREVPEFFGSLDGAAWCQAILDYAEDPSPRREAQLRRLADWRSPSWKDHFAAVEALIADLASR